MESSIELCTKCNGGNSSETGRTVENLDIDLVRTIFNQAYLAGREDGLNGVFIECGFAFEHFLEHKRLL